MARPFSSDTCGDAWIDTGGVLLRYRLEGDGSPVVLIHELGGSLESWDGLVGELARRHTVIRYDQRGAGRSEHPAAPFALDDLVGDLEALLDALDIAEPVHFVGAAFGAAQAIAFTAANREAVASLTLLAPALDISDDSKRLVLERAERASIHGMRAIEGTSLDRAWPHARRTEKARFDEYRHRYLCADPQAFAFHNWALSDFDVTGDLAGIRAPTLVVAGIHDRVRPPYVVKAYAQTLPESRYAEIEAAHLMAVEDPAATCTLLRDFIADLEQRPPRPTRLMDPTEGVLSDAQEAAVAEAVAGARGRIPAPMRAWLVSPEFARRAQALGEAMRYGTSLGPRLSELAIIVTARLWQSEYEWRVHAAAAAKAGISAAIIEQVRVGYPPDGLKDDEQAVVDVGAAFARYGYLSDELFWRAEGHLGRVGLAELIGIYGYYTLVSMTLNAYAIGTSDGVDPFARRATTRGRTRND